MYLITLGSYRIGSLTTFRVFCDSTGLSPTTRVLSRQHCEIRGLFLRASLTRSYASKGPRRPPHGSHGVALSFLRSAGQRTFRPPPRRTAVYVCLRLPKGISVASATLAVMKKASGDVCVQVSAWKEGSFRIVGGRLYRGARRMDGWMMDGCGGMERMDGPTDGRVQWKESARVL